MQEVSEQTFQWDALSVLDHIFYRNSQTAAAGEIAGLLLRGALESPGVTGYLRWEAKRSNIRVANGDIVDYSEPRRPSVVYHSVAKSQTFTGVGLDLKFTQATDLGTSLNTESGTLYLTVVPFADGKNYSVNAISRTEWLPEDVRHELTQSISELRTMWRSSVLDAQNSSNHR